MKASTLPPPVEVREVSRIEAVLHAPESFPDEYPKVLVELARKISAAACNLDWLARIDSVITTEAIEAAKLNIDALHDIADQISGGRIYEE